MKTIAKRLFATVLALALVCTMVTGFAANTASVTRVEVLDSADDAEPTIYNTLEDIDVVEGQLIKVYTTLTTTEIEGEGEEAVEKIVNALGDITFLSADFSAALSNNTIQYVAQITAEDGAAVFTFRPRATLGTGTFGAKVGGTGVANAATFSYDVEKAIVTLNLKAVDGTSIKENDETTNIAFELENYTTGDLTVVLGEETLKKDEDYTITGTTLTILNAAIPKTVKDYTLTVSGTGYTTAEATITVEQRDAVDLVATVTSGEIREGSNTPVTISLSSSYTAYNTLTVAIKKGEETITPENSIQNSILTIQTTGLAAGEYTVEFSGYGYNSASTTFEILEKLPDQLYLNGEAPEFEIDEITDETVVTYTVVGVDAENMPKVAVKSDAEGAEYADLTEGFAYATEGETTTLTINVKKVAAATGIYTVKIYGDGYAEATNTFAVKADSSVKLELVGEVTTFEQGNTTTDIVFTIKNYTEGDLVVELDNVVLESGYAIEDGKLIIYNATIDQDTATTHNVKVYGDKYYEGTGSFTVTEKAVVPDPEPGEDLTDEEVGEAQDKILDVDFTVTDNTVTIPETITIESGKEVAIENDITLSDNALTEVDGVITYDSTVENAPFVSKAEVSIWVEGKEDAARTETIYFIHPNTTEIAFGNVTAITAQDGKSDAFATKEDFEYAITNNNAALLATRAKALNAVLGRKANIVTNDTLDYDQNTTITLNEYRIFKLMLDNDAENHEAFLYENVMTQRASHKVSE